LRCLHPLKLKSALVILEIWSWWKFTSCSRIYGEKVMMRQVVIVFVQYSSNLKDHCCVHSISPKSPPWPRFWLSFRSILFLIMLSLSWRTIHFRLAMTSCSVYWHLLLYPEAISSIRNLRTRHSVVTEGARTSFRY